jgi:hypothetical protein
MTRSLVVAFSVLLAAAPSAAQTDPHAHHDAAPSSGQASAVPAKVNEAIPSDAERAKAALNASPRHGEWADVNVAGGATPIRTWVVYPERRDKAPVVIVIHEIYGLSDWIRAVADQLTRCLGPFKLLRDNHFLGRIPRRAPPAVARRDVTIQIAPCDGLGAEPDGRCIAPIHRRDEPGRPRKRVVPTVFVGPVLAQELP